MANVKRLDHIGITVSDLDAAIAFFERVGLEVEGRMPMSGEFLDTVIGIPEARCEIAVLRPPDGSGGVELTRFTHPPSKPGSPASMANELGLRNVCFEVDDLATLVGELAADGYSLVGDVGRYESMWRMAYVRGPDGIIVSLADRIDTQAAAQAGGDVPSSA